MVCFRRAAARQKDTEKDLDGPVLGKKDAPESWFNHKGELGARRESNNSDWIVACLVWRLITTYSSHTVGRLIIAPDIIWWWRYQMAVIS